MLDNGLTPEKKCIHCGSTSEIAGPFDGYLFNYTSDVKVQRKLFSKETITGINVIKPPIQFYVCKNCIHEAKKKETPRFIIKLIPSVLFFGFMIGWSLQQSDSNYSWGLLMLVCFILLLMGTIDSFVSDYKHKKEKYYVYKIAKAHSIISENHAFLLLGGMKVNSSDDTINMDRINTTNSEKKSIFKNVALWIKKFSTILDRLFAGITFVVPIIFVKDTLSRVIVIIAILSVLQYNRTLKIIGRVICVLAWIILIVSWIIKGQ